MKLLRFSVIAVFACLSAALGGCSDDDGIDNRDLDYGYVQFKLYKEASYDATRAIKPQLDFLSEASKVKVTFYYNEQTIAQTLILSAADKQTAEFGMRSEKLKLLTGTYQIITFSLLDANDETIYNGTTENNMLEVVAGGLTSHDLTVDVMPRGSVKFTIEKDLSGFKNQPNTRTVNRQYAFREIAYVDITVRQKITNEQTTFKMLPAKYSVHFDDDEDTYGYQTSSLACDTLLSLKGGDYTIFAYETYDSNKNLLESNRRPNEMKFTIEDNKTTEATLGVMLYEADEYIKDYYALYEIWKALDGEHWYFKGENYPDGTNWDFNKDPDLWGDQPGVELHSNGRVARLFLNNFGIRGHLPAAIGQLDQLVTLQLGTHNDLNLLVFDPTVPSPKTDLTELARTRMDRHKQYLGMIHPPTQFTEPIARGLKEQNIDIPAISLYKDHTEDELIDRKTGYTKYAQLFDMVPGKLSNGLQSIDPAIGKLKKLETLFIANCEVETLPEEMAELTALTDLEVYNCPKMTRFPLVLAKMPELITVNLANNPQWSAEEAYKGLDALANGASKEKIQIFYFRQNKLKEVPESMSNMKKLGNLDLAYNQIETIHPLGKDIALVSLFLDHNRLTSIPSQDGYFCGMDDVETFSVTYNRLKMVPNIFKAKSKFVMKTVDFSSNEIEGFEGAADGTYAGLNAETLILAANNLTEFPTCLTTSDSKISFLNLRGNQIKEIPEKSFTGKYSSWTTTFDLSYNQLKKLPKDFTAESLPYLSQLELSYNSFDKFPWEPLNCSSLLMLALRYQRDENGNRCLKEWPKGLYNHTGLRAFYVGGNDLRKIDDTISTLIYYLEIIDNPNITFDAADICYAWQRGAYILIYDKSQNILNCEQMLE